MHNLQNWEAVIGLEIHVQLNTKSKLFSCAPNRFGDEPNTNITDVCTGQPGTLPVLNKEAVRKAVQFGAAIQAQISQRSRFDRKSYFYPDSPRNYQITQFFEPILLGGTITAQVGSETKSFTVDRAHLEDDSGMLRHFSNFAAIDYNRAGVPLIEIVSKPCIHSAQEAVAYAMAIKSIMTYLDASDCNMEEGSLRIDANISVRPKGSSSLRNKIEIKNMNSFSNMELAIEGEITRQIAFYTSHPEEELEQATFRFDPQAKRAVLMRKKEKAADYCYFPEPDLPPLILSEEYIHSIISSLPELPQQRHARYAAMGLPVDTIQTLIADKALSDYFDRAQPLCKNSKMLSNWILVEFVGRLKESSTPLPHSKIPPEHIAYLVNMIEEGLITGKIAKSVADDMFLHPQEDPRKIVERNPNYKPLEDTAFLDTLIDQVLAENPQSIADFHAGKARAYDFLIGQVMKLCKGTALPTQVRSRLSGKIST